MSVETATYFPQLNATLPANPDLILEGAAHIRLLKSSIKATFPNWTNAALQATQAQIDALAVGTAGVSSTPNALQAGSFRVGTTQIGAPVAVDTLASGSTTSITAAHGTLLVNSVSTTTNLSIAAPAGFTKGHVLIIKKLDTTGSVQIAFSFGGTLDGSALVTLSAPTAQSRWIQFDGANWHTLAAFN